MEIRLKKIDPLRPALQGHSRLSESTWFDRSVGYLCLPINVPGNYIVHISRSWRFQ